MLSFSIEWKKKDSMDLNKMLLSENMLTFLKQYEINENFGGILRIAKQWTYVIKEATSESAYSKLTPGKTKWCEIQTRVALS